MALVCRSGRSLHSWCLSATQTPPTSSELRTRGKALLQENCSRCHAIERRRQQPAEGGPADAQYLSPVCAARAAGRTRARAWFPGTGRCRRSSFPTRIRMRSSPICMRLPSGNDADNRLITGGQAVENRVDELGKSRWEAIARPVPELSGFDGSSGTKPLSTFLYSSPERSSGLRVVSMRRIKGGMRRGWQELFGVAGRKSSQAGSIDQGPECCGRAGREGRRPPVSA